MARFLYKTVKPSGGDYTSLEACLNANEQDLTGDGWFDVEIDGTWSSADTSAVTIHNYTTTSSDYINIYTTTTARHLGVYPTDRYRIEPAQALGVDCISNAVNYVKLDGLAGRVLQTNDYGKSFIADASNKPPWYVTNCLCKGDPTWGSNGLRMLGTSAGGYTLYVYNNIAYGFVGVNYYGMNFDYWAVNLYNNTVYGCTSGKGINVVGHGGTNVVAKNNISIGNATDFSSNFGTSSNNLSGDTTAPGTDCVKSVTAANTLLDPTGTPPDLHLKAGSAAIGAGYDLSGTFTTDIDGETRSSWDIGADELISSRVIGPGEIWPTVTM